MRTGRGWASIAVSLMAALSACSDGAPTAPLEQVFPAPLASIAVGPPPDVRAAPAGLALPVSVMGERPRLSVTRDFGIGTAAATAAGTPSLVWYATDGTATIWKMNGTSGPVAGEGGPILSIPAPWKLVGSGDLNGDGHPDLIWEEYTMGTRAVTFMNGPAYAGSYAMMFQFSADWKIIGIIDFNFDNKPDLVVNNTVTRATGVLFMNGTAWSGAFNYLPSWAPPWNPVAIADMTGDQKPDILLYNAGTFFIGVLDGLTWTQSTGGDTQPGFEIGAVGDFDLDRDNDVVWQNLTDGSRKIVFMNGPTSTHQGVPLPSVSTSNRIVAAPKIRYTVAPLNLTLTNYYVAQSVQDLSRSVPLVAGRNAFVRAFVAANDYNDAAPTVRIRITQSGGSFTDFNVTRAGDPGVPSFFMEGAVGTSYNATIPGALINAGTTVSIAVDPSNAIAETNESDNAASTSLVVRSVPPFSPRFVPIHLASGATGNVNAGNIPLYMGMTMRIWPFAAYDADLHATFNSTVTEIATDTSWNKMILEIRNLKIAEGNARYYYGVVPQYGASWAGGYGYGGYPTAIGLGASSATDSSISEINAHEWGHNFNRPHSPGCGAGGADPLYPVATGNVDSYGYDASTNQVYSPAGYYDIMSYCFPKWVSGWSFKQVLNWVAPAGLLQQSGAVPSLLVSGRIRADGTIILEPAFEIATTPVEPSGHGLFSIQGLNQQADVLFSYDFDPTEIPDNNGAENHFSFALPVSKFNHALLHKIRVLDHNHNTVGSIARISAPNGAPAPETHEVLARAPEGVELRWNSAAFPSVMVRDAETGEVIAFAKGGVGRMSSKGRGTLELVFSDGVKSITKRVPHP